MMPFRRFCRIYDQFYLYYLSVILQNEQDKAQTDKREWSGTEYNRVKCTKTEYFHAGNNDAQPIITVRQYVVRHTTWPTNQNIQRYQYIL